jgi:hypothetical protein
MGRKIEVSKVLTRVDCETQIQRLKTTNHICYKVRLWCGWELSMKDEKRIWSFADTRILLLGLQFPCVILEWKTKSWEDHGELWSQA